MRDGGREEEERKGGRKGRGGRRGMTVINTLI